MFEASIPAETLRTKARRIKKAAGQMTSPPPTPPNSCEILEEPPEKPPEIQEKPDDQVLRPQTVGARGGSYWAGLFAWCRPGWKGDNRDPTKPPFDEAAVSGGQ